MINLILKIFFFPIYIFIYLFSFIIKNIDKIIIILFQIFYLFALFIWNCVKYIYIFICWIIDKIKDSNSNNKTKVEYENSKITNKYNQQEIENDTLSPKIKICEKDKIEEKQKNNKNTSYKKEMKKATNTYYDDYNSAKLNNIIYQESKNIIKQKKKNIDGVYEYIHLVLYLSKKNTDLIRNNEINYKLLDMNKQIFPYLWLDVYDEEKNKNNKYIKFIDDSYTSKDYSEVILKILEYCKNDTYITLGYEYENYKYKFLYKEGKIILENYNLENFNSELKNLERNIKENYDIISKYMFKTKMETIEMPNNPQPDVNYEDVTTLVDKFNNHYEFKITDLPYINEVDNILAYISNNLDEDATKDFNKLGFTNSKKKEFPEIIHDTYSLRIYLSYSFKKLINIETDEINYKELGIKELNDIDPYIDDEEYRFVIHIDEPTNKDFSKLLMALFRYCKDGIFAIYGYEDIDEFYKYKFLYINGKICVEDYTEFELKKMYEKLKNDIINTFDNIENKLLEQDDIDFDDINPNSEFDYYDIIDLIKNLKESSELSVLELPIMEMANETLKKIKNEIKNLDIEMENNDLSNVFNLEKKYYEHEEDKKKNSIPKNDLEEKLFYKNEKFEKEANLCGLSKEDRKIANEERMPPADFIEAEERDDDELFIDE